MRRLRPSDCRSHQGVLKIFMRRPEIDLSACNDCGSCIEVSPTVFSFNDLGFVQVADLESYPEAEVDEAIALCPEDCISWEE